MSELHLMSLGVLNYNEMKVLTKRILNITILLICLVKCNYAQDKVFTSDVKKSVLEVSLDKVIIKDFLGVNAVYHGFALPLQPCGEEIAKRDRKRRPTKSINITAPDPGISGTSTAVMVKRNSMTTKMIQTSGLTW